MSAKHVFRKAERTPEETARLKADRERYQREKPSPEQLLAESGQADFIPLGELLLLRRLASELRAERERQGVTLAELSDRTGIDATALSRLETGRHDNPTVGTLYRIAAALGREIYCGLRPAAEGHEPAPA
jgi:DNA-binding Xre family transcriptional regulator